MNPGVPTGVVTGHCPLGANRAEPASSTTTVPTASIATLGGFMSKWSTPWECQQSTACTYYTTTRATVNTQKALSTCPNMLHHTHLAQLHDLLQYRLHSAPHKQLSWAVGGNDASVHANTYRAKHADSASCSVRRQGG